MDTHTHTHTHTHKHTHTYTHTRGAHLERSRRRRQVPFAALLHSELIPFSSSPLLPPFPLQRCRSIPCVCVFVCVCVCVCHLPPDTHAPTRSLSPARGRRPQSVHVRYTMYIHVVLPASNPRVSSNFASVSRSASFTPFLSVLSLHADCCGPRLLPLLCRFKLTTGERRREGQRAGRRGQS